uniref:Exonuclease domain-containing protein n=1 Tax=Quercus lobata TaxID=97700 RepID=A0A7N2MQE8_QUELO
MGSSSGEERSEIVFFDVETIRRGQRSALLEFGAILVCPRKLVELDSFATLVRPADLSFISTMYPRSNGITPDAVVSAPTFLQISDRVYDLLHGRIWAGHNILRFDCAKIREAFVEIGKPAPEPKGAIDSLQLLTQKFGRRAGDMKSHSSDFLVPVDISGVFPLPSPSFSSHCQKRVTAVTLTVPATLGSHCSTHPTVKAKALSD